MNKELIPSKYQQDIFDWVKYGVGNCVINAVAGSGKTYSIIKCLDLIPNTQKILFLAFNKSIQEELKNRITLPNCEVLTLHSLGLKFISNYIKNNYNDNNVNLDENKYRKYLKTNLFNLRENKNFDSEKQEKVYIDNCIDICNFGRLNLCQSSKEFENICVKYDIILIDDEIQVVKKIIEWGKNSINTSIDYTDMIYLPIIMNIDVKYLKYDFVFIDEIQDLSPLQHKLFLKTLKRGGRFCGVGDKSQCIYMFSGANENSYDTLCKQPNTIQLPLTISYRCPQVIGELAKEFVPNFEVRENAPLGLINKDVKFENIVDGDMVLCRNNFPLIQLYTKLILQNKKAHIKGKDIGINLIRLVEKMDKEFLYSDLSSDGVFVRLYEDLLEERNKIILYNKIDIDTSYTFDNFLNYYDKIKTLLLLSYNLTTTTELIDKINTIFEDEINDGVMLSTIHKAKGLESDNIFVLCPSLLSSKQIKQFWEIQQEKNLEYVCYTRAKKTLNFICETDFPPNNYFFNQASLIKEIKNIEEKISHILNKSFFIEVPNLIEENKEFIVSINEIENINKKKNKFKVL